MAREKVEFDVVGNDKGGSKAFKDTGDAAAKAGRQVDDFKDELKQLDAQTVKSRAELALLAREFARTGDQDVWKNLRKQKGELRKLLDTRKIMEDAGGDGATGFFAGFSQKIGPLMAKAPVSGPVLAAIAGASAAAAPMLASVISAAVTTGVAGAGIAVGIKLATRDPAVQAAGKSLGEQFGRDLGSSASSFVPEVLKSVDIIGDKLTELRPQLRAIFDVSSSRVVPLTHSVTEAIDRLIPSLAKANANAGPLMVTLNEHIPKAADAAGHALEKFSEDSQNSAAALDTVLTAVEAMVGGSATIIGFLNKIGPAVSGPLYALGALSEDTGDKAEVAAGKTAGWDASFRALSTSTRQAAIDLRSFTERIEDWTSANLGAENSNLRLQEAIDAATAAGKKNNDGIDANTAKGRANRELLIQLADAANTNAQKIYEQTGSMEKANAATAAARVQFIAAARAMGVGAAEAERLAGMLFAIPSVKPTVKLDASQAKAEARVVQAAINGIKGKNVTVGIWFVEHGRGKGNLKVPEGQLTKADGGRIYGPGTGTSDDIVARVSNGEFVIREAAARAIGYDTLDALNNVDRTARFGVGPDARPGPIAGASQLDEERVVRMLVRGLQAATLRIDDRTATFVDLLVRGG